MQERYTLSAVTVTLLCLYISQEIRAVVLKSNMNHGVPLNANHRMLRAIDAVSALRAHFKLGVNFVASVVNRHRIEEVYLLGAAGTIADRSSASIGTNRESSIERC